MNERPINVGIVGLGRSGWDIHARTLEKLGSLYRVAAVVDGRSERREEAVQRFNCRAYAELPELLVDSSAELVVIATPSHLHPQHAIEAFRHRKHVISEKPMAPTVAEADRMIEASEQAGRVLTVFNNMRYVRDFQKVREVIASGKLGRIVQIKINLHRFSRRWDWQTLRQFGGGALLNAGAHLVDLAMQFLGDVEPTVTADLQRTLTSGDAEDHATIFLRAPGAPSITVEITNAAAYPQEMWHVMGTAGGLHGSSDELHWKWLDLAALPDRPVDASQAAADRRYNREDLPWQEQSWVKGSEDHPDYADFYRDLHRPLREQGKGLVITPQSVRRTLRVLETCRKVGGL